MAGGGLAGRAAFCALLVGAALLLRWRLPASVDVMQRLLVGPSDGPAEQAFSSLVSALDEEESVPDAIAVFCETFLESLRD